MRGTLLTLCLVLVAGCSEPSPPVDVVSAPSSSTSSGPAAPAETIVEVVPMSFDGTLGTSAHGCLFPAGACHTAELVSSSSDLLVERPGANLTALSFEVTWEAQSPATQTLVVGSMVMVSCEGCNATHFGEVEGPSPLRVEVSGVSVPLHEEAVVHVFVYNPQGFVYDPAVPGYALVSVDQPFHIEGTATLVVPPA